MSQRKIIINLCTSLDAFIEGANGEIDWCLMDQDYGMTAFLNRIDTIFFGRKSYEQLLTLAPNAFADKNKVVFSTSLKSYKPDVLISSNMEQTTQEILNSEGKDIWLFGGASLITDMMNSDLVDEMMIAVHPLILGGGKPLFVDIETRKQLKLMDTVTYSTGLVQLIYEVEKGTT